jgi:aspartate/tyrosine/aromatic aminotransferase
LLPPKIEAAIGARKLLSLFIETARKSKNVFVAGPVWNQADSLVAGDTQCLRYTFANAKARQVDFKTSELENYGLGEAATLVTLGERIAKLLIAD